MDLIEGPVRFRKGKKWKTRWAVLRRVNPAADALNVAMYSDQQNARTRQKEKAFLSLEGFCGLQLLNKMDKHFNVIVIITTAEVIPLSFETIDQRAHWLAQLQNHFGKEKSFEGIVPHKQKIKAGEAVLRFYNSFFSLTRKDNYRCIGMWKLKALPKYGAVEGGFAFQAGQETPGTADKPVVYFFSTRSGREIHELFDSVCRVGEATYSRYTQQETSQPGPSEDENQGQPNFFKRAWLRVSGRRPRKRKDVRPRSQSVPSNPHSRKKCERSAETSAEEQNTTSVTRNESVPSNLGARGGFLDNSDDVFLSDFKSNRESTASPTPGYENLSAPPPEGYEIMDSESSSVGRKIGATGNPTWNGAEMLRKRKIEREKRSSSHREGKCESKYEKVDEKDGEVEGYVVVEGRDEELLEAIRTKSDAREKEKKELKEKEKASSRKTSSRSSESDKGKFSTSEKTRNEGAVENGAVRDGERTDEAQKEKEKNKSSSEQQGLKNGQISCQIVVTKSSETDDGMEVEEEESNSRERAALSKEKEEKSELEKNVKAKNKNSANKENIANGDVTQEKELDDKKSNKVGSVSSRRRAKTPPQLFLPVVDGASAEHLYVNSPAKTAEYVNLKGNRPSPSASRSRSKIANHTGKPSGSRTKLNPYAMYDGNDDSIYHSVESLMPSHPGYQNILAEDSSRCHSFENIAGHSYANVGGANAYQNVGASYVNVPSRPNQGNLNYIRVAGVEDHPPSPLTSTSPKSTKPSSDYTWIDEKRTQLLKDTARMHSDLRRENLPRVMKK